MRDGQTSVGSVDFTAFVNAELPALTRFAAVLTGDRQLAHDVLADALILAADRWDSVGGMAHPRAYVRRIVVTTFLAGRRKTLRRRTDPSGDLGSMPGGAASEDGPDDRDQLRRLLTVLPPQQRAAVVLRFYLDLPDDRIAEALNCRPGTVRTHISRALQTLRLTETATRTED